MADPRPSKPAALPAAGDRPLKDLSQVNERLRELIASLKTARERHESSAPPEAVPARPPAPSAAGAPDEELQHARDSLIAVTAERNDLRERLEQLEHEVGRISDDYVLVQEQSSELAQLYVALERIHGSLTREEVLQALQEIVINVVGSEEFTVHECVDDRLALIHHFGVDSVPLREVKLGDGVIGKSVQRGKIFVAGRDGPVDAADADVTAAVPLFVGNRVWGVLTIFRLLGHKPVLGDSDHVVFELIKGHAGIALSLRATGN
jgi:hypothetical protein